jgi:cytochrome c-type biogenesis protein CcmH
MKYLNIYSYFFCIKFNSLNAQEEDLQSKITKNLRCLICQGQSVYDSDSEFANSLKILVKKKLMRESEKQIYDYLKDKYGEWILYDPEFSKKTYFLWLLPILMFLLVVQ